MKTRRRATAVAVVFAVVTVPITAFFGARLSVDGRSASSPSVREARHAHACPLSMARGGRFRPERGESKRQARVAQLVTTELAGIIRAGHSVKTADGLADAVRSKISVVDVLMSADLRTARVLVSVYGDVFEKREAFAWLVRNAKPIRSALATSLRDMKAVPELFFRQTDVGAAVDVMALVDRVSGVSAVTVGGSTAGNAFGEEAGPTGVIGGLDFDASFDDEDDDDFLIQDDDAEEEDGGDGDEPA